MTQELRVKGKIDKLGRVVIPKKMREALHLQPDGHVEMSVRNGELTLKGEQPRYHIEYAEDGWPLIHIAGAIAADFENIDSRDDRSSEDLAAWR